MEKTVKGVVTDCTAASPESPTRLQRVTRGYGEALRRKKVQHRYSVDLCSIYSLFSGLVEIV